MQKVVLLTAFALSNLLSHANACVALNLNNSGGKPAMLIRQYRTAAQQGDAFSISDITRVYVKQGEAEVVSVGEETWVDCGTPDSLLQASIMAKEGKLNPNPHR